MSESQFLSYVDEAAQIWNSEYPSTLFEYDPQGDIEINLVYDQRQFLNSQINELDTQVKSEQGELDTKIADYNRRAQEFQIIVKKLNEDIQYWNERGGAPPDEYESLIQRQKSVQSEAESLKSEAASLNQSTDIYNQQVGELNQTIRNFNEELKYKPEQGEYVYSGGKETINIYFDTSREELVHTLAHEFGHAIGIPHMENESAIMFSKTTTVTVLSADDRIALETACAEKNIVEERLQSIPQIFDQLRSNLAR